MPSTIGEYSCTHLSAAYLTAERLLTFSLPFADALLCAKDLPYACNGDFLRSVCAAQLVPLDSVLCSSSLSLSWPVSESGAAAIPIATSKSSWVTQALSER